MYTKYGELSQAQIHDHKNELHDNILALLYMKEQDCPTLSAYFYSLIWKLSGYNEIFGNQVVMIDIMASLEEARIESEKDCYDHKKYRKLILDAFNMIDELKESDGSSYV
jgi:hypothetical protein